MECFGILDHKADQLRNEIHRLDLEDELPGLKEGDMIRRKEAAVEVLLNLKRKNSLNA